MNILILNGSPHPKGTSALLIEQFTKGAAEKGHTVNIFNAAKETLHPCLGCDHCRNTGNGCVYKDSMETLNPLLLEADLVVFSTPLYYFGMSAQIKMVVDRFYANNTALRENPKKALLLATCGDTDNWAMDALKSHYEAICKYLKWESLDTLLAVGMYVREDIENSEYPEKAYELGLAI